MISIPFLKSDRYKTVRVGKILRILRDLSPFNRPEYFLIAGPHSLCFFTLLPGKKICILAQTDAPQIEDQAFLDFLSRLKAEGYYFGQEITLLVSEPAAYTMIKSQDKVDLDDLRKECSSLFQEETLQKVHTVGMGDKKYFVVSGVDTAYLTKIKPILEDRGYLVGGIMSLSGFVLTQMLGSRAELKFKKTIIALGSHLSFVSMADDEGPLYYESSDFHDDKPETGSNLLAIMDLSNPDSQGKARIFASSREEVHPLTTRTENIRWDSLEKFFTFSPNSRRHFEYLLRDLIPPLTRYGIIAASSARLLNFILIGLLVLSSVAAITFSVIGKSSEELYNQYHEKLSQIYGIESELAMVKSKISSLKTDHFSTTHFGACLSIFCQKVPYDLCLTELQCQPISAGNAGIIAKGMARRETSVFKYKSILGEVATGIDFKIKSITRLAPNAVGPDSLAYRFVLASE